MPNEDRRTHERYPVRVNVTLHTGTGESIHVASRDFSAGGVFLECSPALACALTVNDKVLVVIHYEDTGATETIHANVVRLEEGGVGLRFDRSKASLSAA